MKFKVGDRVECVYPIFPEINGKTGWIRRRIDVHQIYYFVYVDGREWPLTSREMRLLPNFEHALEDIINDPTPTS